LRGEHGVLFFLVAEWLALLPKVLFKLEKQYLANNMPFRRMADRGEADVIDE
jgi:hypothetical protein